MDSFGAALNRLLHDSDISASELAKRLGMRSKTTLQRILQDRSGYASVQKFWNQLLASRVLPITDADCAHMESLLQVLRVGPEHHRAHQALRALLREQPSDGAPIAVTGISGVTTFDDLTARYAASQQLELTIVGMCDPRIFEALQRMCAAMSADRQPKLRHYIFHISDATETILNIRAMLPVLFQRNYEAYMAQPSQALPRRYFPGEMLLCRMTDPDGTSRYHQLAFAAPDTMHALTHSDAAVHEYWQQLIHACAGSLLPITADFDGARSAADYLSYIEQIRRLELNSNIYMLKPDIPLCLIPSDILYAAVADGPLGDHADVLRQLYASHDMRHRHLFDRRKVMHCIFSRQAMLNFAQTGRMSDHFFAARCFTPPERAAILRHCLEQNQNNPYFNIHFSRSDELIQSAEITCYEGKGTILLNAHTAYRLDGDHTEALITHPGFNQQLRAYYTGELLRNHVLPGAETHAFLRQLIDIALAAR